MKSLCIALIVAGSALAFAGSAEAGPYRGTSVVYSGYGYQPTYAYSYVPIVQPYVLEVVPVVYVPRVRTVSYYVDPVVTTYYPITYSSTYGGSYRRMGRR